MSSRVLAIVVALLLALAGLGPHAASSQAGAGPLLETLAGSTPDAGTPHPVADEHPAQACVDHMNDLPGLSPAVAAAQIPAAALRPAPERRLARSGPVLEGPRRPPRTASTLA